MSGTESGPGGGNEGQSFEARLQAARERRGLVPRADASGRLRDGLPASALGIGVRVAIELVSALVLSVGIGWGLDRLLHTTPLFVVVFFFLGGAAGVLNVWRLMGPGRTKPGDGR